MNFFSNALRAIFPDQCLQCGALVDGSQALCGSCWKETSFITGTVCDACGVPLIGEGDGKDHCDDCLKIERSWGRGRSAIRYEGAGRRIVLALKHGDRTDIAKPAAGWMWLATKPLLKPGMIVIPVPIHRARLVKRRYNQSALLAQHFAEFAELEYWPDALIRTRSTPLQDGLNQEERFANLDGAIMAAGHMRSRLDGASVVLIDDVMTSGATLEACARACLAAGADQVFVSVLARVTKDT
ncbi:MAG: ComF family protein [Rhodobacteraceae bacterium]|nr:ComF family protein [Paracoccaceae bacterium]